MKRALIVAATGGFLNGFLIPDMKLLQEMGYEVHCAANGNSVSTFVPEEQFASIGVTFHQIDFSSTSPISKESLTAYKQYKELLNKYQFDFVHVHTPIPGAIVRMATRRKRKRGCVVVYTTHGLTFPKGSSLKTKIVYGGVEWLCSWMTDGIITINREDYAQMKKMGCKNVYHINGVGVDTSRYHECQIDREIYRKSLGLSENDIAILEVGELSTRKNHKVIIDALEKLADQRYVFLICGKAMSNLGTYDFLKKYAAGFEHAVFLDTADMVGIRESRHIKGKYWMTGEDALACRVPEDTIAVMATNMDTHNKDNPGGSFITIQNGSYFGVPYRCLLPQGVENLLVAGRCISADALAGSAIRMIPCCLSFGQAAGTAAALSLKKHIDPVEVCVGELRACLEKQDVYLGGE